jgi:hypothetical protein
MQLFLHSKKNLNMFTKKPFYLLVSMLFIFSAGSAQSVIFKFTNSTTAAYPISEIQNFTYASNNTDIVIKRVNGTTVTYNLSSVSSYRFDGTSSVNDLNIINSAEVRIYPNPFKGAVHISYELLSAEKVTIEILDMTGRSIKKWPAEKKVPGKYEVIWQTNDTKGKTLQPGTYICRIQTSIGSVSKMMIME